MAKAKGGAVSTILMIGAFVLMIGFMYWLSVTAVPASSPAAMEEPEAPAPAAAEEVMDGAEAEMVEEAAGN